MDINFHYFAIKTLARFAGFEENEAQRIAVFSQYIDDFDWITYLDCKNIPDYIKNDVDCDLHCTSLLTLNMNFNPAMTGFFSYIDLAFLYLERSQKFTVSPFHFIPQNIALIAKDSRTIPAQVGDGSIISDLLLEARAALLAGEEPRNRSLMRIGMYLHTFADTYAHQLFSGYESWVNEVTISNVINNATGNNIADTVMCQTNEMLEQDPNFDWPAIGHARAEHTPDLTYVSFTMQYKRDIRDTARSLVYTRSNTTEFLIAARHILNYLRGCRNLEAVTEAEWQGLADRISNVFLIPYTDKTTIPTYVNNWRNAFPEYEYNFNKKDIEASFRLSNANDASGTEEPNSLFGKNYTEEFYRYNYIADKVLNKMYGPKPRSAWWN